MPLTDLSQISESIAESVISLHNEEPCPIVFIGFSFGTNLAIACAKYIEDNHSHIAVGHIFSLAGIDCRAVPPIDTDKFTDDELLHDMRVVLNNHKKEQSDVFQDFTNIGRPLREGNRSHMAII